MADDAPEWNDPQWPVSVKGVLIVEEAVLLLRNERDEWELPGGRLETTDASPEAAVQREFLEEVGIDVAPQRLIDSWIYDVADKRVLIVTYECGLAGPMPERLALSEEHTAVCLAPIDRLPAALPDGYRRSIAAAQ